MQKRIFRLSLRLTISVAHSCNYSGANSVLCSSACRIEQGKHFLYPFNSIARGKGRKTKSNCRKDVVFKESSLSSFIWFDNNLLGRRHLRRAMLFKLNIGRESIPTINRWFLWKSRSIYEVSESDIFGHQSRNLFLLTISGSPHPMIVHLSESYNYLSCR